MCGQFVDTFIKHIFNKPITLTTRIEREREKNFVMVTEAEQHTKRNSMKQSCCNVLWRSSGYCLVFVSETSIYPYMSNLWTGLCVYRKGTFPTPGGRSLDSTACQLDSQSTVERAYPAPSVTARLNVRPVITDGDIQHRKGIIEIEYKCP